MNITKAVIPAAGLGTRFLPITKVIPKETLPILNTPAIQLIIQEGLASAIDKFYIITSKDKTALVDYFDLDSDLNLFLEKKHKLDLITPVNEIIKQAHFAYIRQDDPLGLGHAVLCARHVIEQQFFGIFLPDDIIVNPHNPAIAQLKKHAIERNATIIAVQEVPRESISAYGVVAIDQEVAPGLFSLSGLVEKPKPEHAPSNYAIIGRYVCAPEIFDAIQATAPKAQGEIQLTDAIHHLIKIGKPVYAYNTAGTRYDIGTPAGWLRAALDFAYQDTELRSVIKAFISKHS